MKATVVRIEGLEELDRKLERMKGSRPLLERAVMAGAEVIAAAANGRAPGPHVKAEVGAGEGKMAKEFGGRAVWARIGPDKAHWYYQFAETGAVGHVIDPLRTQSGAVRKRPRKKALAFLDRVRARVKHGGMAARPFLRPALDERQAEATEAMAAVLRAELEAVAGGH